MILTQDALIGLTIVIGGLGFMFGWVSAWIVGAFKSLTEEERRIYAEMWEK